MTRRPEKHSLTLRGHRTSVSLEPEFWAAFRRIAAARGQGLNELATAIDEARGSTVGLASAIRVFVLTEVSIKRDDAANQRRSGETRPSGGGDGT